jgi:hypothetical protein
MLRMTLGALAGYGYTNSNLEQNVHVSLNSMFAKSTSPAPETTKDGKTHWETNGPSST